MQRIIRIHPHGARAQRIRHLDRRVQIARVHRRRQAVRRLVADGDGLGAVLELADAAHGAEDLLLHDLHVLGDVGEDGGFDEVALVALAVAADFHLGAGLFAGFDVAVHCRQYCACRIGERANG